MPQWLKDQIEAALKGDSNDAEFSALWAVAEYFKFPLPDSE